MTSCIHISILLAVPLCVWRQIRVRLFLGSSGSMEQDRTTGKCFRVAISKSRVYNYWSAGGWWTKEIDPPRKPRKWWTIDLPSSLIPQLISLPILTSGMTNRKRKVLMKPSAGTLARRESSAFLRLHLKRTSDIWHLDARTCSQRPKHAKQGLALQLSFLRFVSQMVENSVCVALFLHDRH